MRTHEVQRHPGEVADDIRHLPCARVSRFQVQSAEHQSVSCLRPGMQGSMQAEHAAQCC